MNFPDIIRSAASNMMRSKIRTLLTITAIVIGAFTITLTVGLSGGVSSYIDKQLGNLGAENLLIIQPKIESSAPSSGPQKYNPDAMSTSAQAAFTSPTLTNDDMKTIAAIDGLSNVQPSILVNPDYVVGPNKEKYILSVQELYTSMNYDLVAGDVPSITSDASEVILPASYVEVLGFDSAQAAIGQTITFTISTPLTVQHTVTATIAAVQQESILTQQGGASITPTLMKQLYAYQTEGLPASATEKYFAFTAEFNPENEEATASIKKTLEKEGFTGTTIEDQIGIIKQVIDAITAVLVFFGAIALLAASFGIINTLYMSVQERTKEIGLMKAMGMSRSKVFLLFSIEAILIGFWGSVIGAGLAIGAGKIANQIATDTFLKDLPGFELTLFPLGSVLVIIGIVMVIALLAGTLPARRAAKQDPIEALRYE